MEFVGQVPSEELGQELGTAFDEESSHGPFGQSERRAPRDAVTGVDEYGAVPQAGLGRGEGRRGAVDQAAGAGGEEAGPGVQVAGGGQGDPGEVLGQAAGGAAGAAARVADQQPGVVRADRARADQDRVAPALTSSTRSRSAGPDRISRAGLASSR